MAPYEIMLSESQERMLIIVHKGREEEVKRIFDKWDLPWAEIGRVTDTGQMVVRNNGSIVANIPAKKLADESPVYQREAREPEYIKRVRAFSVAGVPDVKNPGTVLKELLRWPTIASKNWVYRQYDHMVRDGTLVAPGSDATVIRIKEDSLPVAQQNGGLDKSQLSVEKLIAISVDCNGTYVYLDPFEGSKIAVSEAARNLACAGARPLGVTDNLNFGNPHNPEIFWQLRESVRGLAEACRAFNTPVTGGNVSLYNQSPAGPIDPTPTVAMVGLIEKPEHITTQWFKDEGDEIILLGDLIEPGDPLSGLGGSAYLQRSHGLKTGTPPPCDLEKQNELHLALRALICSGVIKSAHDCSEGGLAVALTESCISNHRARGTDTLLGANIDLTAINSSRTDALLFGETQSRIVISVAPANADKVLAQAKSANITATKIGTVGGSRLTIKTKNKSIEAPLEELHDAWWNSIARTMAS
jgi:phosphoribosylformylglycinamidine synthase